MPQKIISSTCLFVIDNFHPRFLKEPCRCVCCTAMSASTVEMPQEPSKSQSFTEDRVTGSSATEEETGGSSTDSYVEDPSSELAWSFSRAIQTMKDMGPEYAEKHLTLTWENMTVLGDPLGDSLVDTVWSAANPMEWIRSLRHSKKEPRVSIIITRHEFMLKSPRIL